MMLFTFGKHKGKDTEDVPSSYLRWFLEKVSERDNPELFRAVEDEMKYRNKHNSHFD